MPKAQKTKSQRKRSSTSKKVSLVGAATHSPLRHLKLVEHKHTLKLVHKTHTSHLALMIILAIVGVFLYASQSIAKADQITVGNGLTVGAVVEGHPPFSGAVITSPTDGTITTDIQTEVSGTCDDATIVTVFNNGQTAGTTSCTVAHVFSLTIQLFDGDNALQALDYDALNQVGPTTPTVTVTSNQAAVVNPTTGEPMEPIRVVANPEPPIGLQNPGIITTLPSATKKDCDTYTGPTGLQSGPFRVTVVCYIRFGAPLATYQLGLLIQGGTAPYAIDISFGTSKVKDQLISINKAGYKVINFAYPNPGVFTIKIHGKDVNGFSAYIETIAEVSGTPSGGILSTIKNDVLDTSWFETPVPFYLIAVTLTAGFWIGDLFDRRFGARKPRRRSA